MPECTSAVVSVPIYGGVPQAQLKYPFPFERSKDDPLFGDLGMIEFGYVVHE